MNTSTPAPSPVQQNSMQQARVFREDEDSIDLLDLLDIVLDQKWLITLLTLLALVIGGVYAWRATPVYESNMLVQIEDNKNNAISLPGFSGEGFFDSSSSIAAEMEILRSRLILGQVAANLQLDLNITPKQPFWRSWLPADDTVPSIVVMPSGAGMGLKEQDATSEDASSEYSSLQLVRFEVAQALRGYPYVVAIQDDDAYVLSDAEEQVLGKAQLGEPISFTHMGYNGALLITGSVAGFSAAEFYLSKRSHLEVTQSLQARLKVSEQGKQSGMLRISIEDTDAVLASRILHETGRLYVQQNTERKAAEAKKSLDFLNTQLPNLKQQVEVAETKFNQFRSEQGTFNLDEEASTYLQQAVALRVELIALQNKRKELVTRVTPQHPEMKILEVQIEALQQQIAEFETRTESLPKVEQDLLRLVRDVQLNNQLYTNLLNNFQELQLVKEGKVANVRIIDPAVVLHNPVKPRHNLILALAGVLGLMIGLVVAFVRSMLKQGIKNPDRIEEELGVNVFASVPLSSIQSDLEADGRKNQSGKQRLLAAIDEDDPAIESLRSFRTALKFAMVKSPNPVVLISGPAPGIGKSFVSANFAAVMAATGQRVLLIDADLRRGHIHKVFNVARNPGLSDLLTSSRELSQVVHKEIAPNLDFISTGTLPPSLSDLLMLPSTTALFASLRKQYDLILVDTAPVLAVADTAIVATFAGAVFLVARAEQTRMDELKESIKRLKQAGITTNGIIFNGIDLNKKRYGRNYGAYTYNRYHYGKSAS